MKQTTGGMWESETKCALQKNRLCRLTVTLICACTKCIVHIIIIVNLYSVSRFSAIKDRPSIGLVNWSVGEIQFPVYTYYSMFMIVNPSTLTVVTRVTHLYYLSLRAVQLPVLELFSENKHCQFTEGSYKLSMSICITQV